MRDVKKKLPTIPTTQGIGSIRQEFTETFQGMSPAILRKLTTTKQGRPIYTQKDVNEVISAPTRLLRQIFVDLGITYEDVKECHRQYVLYVLKDADTSSWGNLSKLFKNPQLTWNRVDEILFHIMGFQFKSMTLEYVDDSGNQLTAKIGR